MDPGLTEKGGLKKSLTADLAGVMDEVDSMFAGIEDPSIVSSSKEVAPIFA